MPDRQSTPTMDGAERKAAIKALEDAATQLKT